jgi:hypothetical protein
MTETSRVVYRPRESATPEAEISALASVYRFVLSKSNANQKAVEPAPEPDGHDDAKKSEGMGSPRRWRT